MSEAILIQPTLRSVKCLAGDGWCSMAYFDWRPFSMEAGIVLCVHGLTRNAHDFDELAKYLVTHYSLRVICVDLPGRGNSDWLNTKALYNPQTYVSCIATLMAELSIGSTPNGYKDCLYVGTSLGGIIGMVLASASNCPISRFFMVDIGPFCPKESLKELRHVVDVPLLKSLSEVINFLKHVACKQWTPMTDKQWETMAFNCTKLDHATGIYSMSYDPGIGNTYRQPVVADLDLWDFFEKIECPTFVLKGKESTLLSQQTLDAMKSRAKCKLESQVLDGVGHVPALLCEEEISIVAKFLMQ